MDICYIDESGSSELLCTSAQASTPVFALVAVIVPEGRVRDLVWEFLKIKKLFSPSLAGPNVQLSDLIRAEIKGADLRGDVRRGGQGKRRAFGIIDRLFDQLDRYDCRIVARVMAKTVDVQTDDRTIYGSSIGWICRTFHRYLDERQSSGLVILDSRTKVKNTPNSDVITTQVFRHGGDPFPRFAEVPVFGHSDSHVVLQIADILASAVVFPTACSAYCSHLGWNHHSHSGYHDIRTRYGPRLQARQFRYRDLATEQWRGGIYSYGNLGNAKPSDMFRSPVQSPTLPGI